MIGAFLRFAEDVGEAMAVAARVARWRYGRIVRQREADRAARETLDRILSANRMLF